MQTRSSRSLAALAGTALLRPDRLALAFLVLSSAVPDAIGLVALRRLPESTFGVLMSLAPATAVIAGFVLLGQTLTAFDLVAIGLVTAASIGAVPTGPAHEPLAESVDDSADRPAKLQDPSDVNVRSE
jgi:inner membrane transporter RhtA